MRSWLPKLNPLISPRLNVLLQPGSVGSETDSAELHVGAVMEDACQGRATDVHFEPLSNSWRVRFRIDGRLHDAAQVPAELGRRMLRYIRTAAALDPVIGHSPEDASFTYKLLDRTLDLRLATAPCVGGEKLALRFLDPQRVQQPIEQLGFSQPDLKLLQGWLAEVSGLFLVTGPTGSGKTTTLYALLHELELSSQAVVTIEDPVEYPVDGVSQMQVDAARGLTFAAGLKAMLRLDPDYLLVGELRDRESAHIAFEAAGSGHCVMGTLHSPDAAGVVSLFRDWGLRDHQIASALQIVVNQRLVRRLCPRCRRPGVLTRAERLWLKTLKLRGPARVWLARGCAACQKTGYHGRSGVFEVWQKDDSDYELILTHADERALRRHYRNRGLKTLLQDGLAKAREGITSLAELQVMGA